MSADLIDLVQSLGEPTVLVLGDVMLDRYIWGDAERISQEAPVILLRAEKQDERLGGASSVATMLRALGARVQLAGVVGGDVSAGRIRQILHEHQIDHSAVLTDASRPSTVKERYIGRAQHKHPQQMLRVDYEVRTPLEPALEAKLCSALFAQLQQADIVLISDYDKGVCTPGVLEKLIHAAKKQGKKVLADPIRGRDYRKYTGCSAITPNRLEAGLATGRTLHSLSAALEAGRQLQQSLQLEAAIITLDRDGMALVHHDGRAQVFPTRPRQVYDITGAGDMVMSMLGMTLALGVDYPQAIRLANIAGGLEVEKIGVATLTRDEILTDLLQHSHTPAQKTLPLDSLCHEVAERRRLGQRVAFTNGCFDLLHVGHVEYLQDAKQQADLLIVAVNSDASVRKLKGNDRPINPCTARTAVLSALQSVDFVTVFEEDTPLKLIEALKPDVLVKGADYRKEDVVGASFVESYGGEVYLSPVQPGFSTTRLLHKLNAA